MSPSSSRIDATRGSRRRELLVNLSLLSGSLLLMVLAGEIVARCWQVISTGSGVPSGTWAVTDYQLIYRLNPDYKDFSPRGSQNDLAGQPAAGYRLLFLGDSVAFQGWQFADKIAGHTQLALDYDRAAPKVEILNMGVPGYTTYQEVQWLKLYGLDFEPRVVGVIYVPNDNYQFLHGLGNDELSFIYRDENDLPGWLARVRERSALLESLRRLVKISFYRIRWSLEKRPPLERRMDFGPAWHDESWILIADQLDELVRMGHEHKFVVLVVAVPYGEQLTKKNAPLGQKYLTKPQRKLREICESLSIPFLDLMPYLQPDAHFDSDMVHLNHVGRTVAGEKIAAFLRERGLVPSGKK